MAGILTKSNVPNWMFDYICFEAWDRFVKNGEFTETFKEGIQGICGMLKDLESFLTTEAVSLKWLFMVTLCRLDDGQDILMVYDEESDETPLELMLPTFEKIINFQAPSLKEEGTKLLQEIRTEAVLVCCRAGDFNLAKKVLNKLWKTETLDTEQKQLANVLKMIVKNKNAQDETLLSYTYETFINLMKKYMDKIFKQFPKPFLLEIDEKKVTSEKQILEESTNSRKRTRNFGADMVGACMEAGNGDKRANDNAKLRKLWNQNVTKLFEAESSAPLEPSQVRRKNTLMPPPMSPPPLKSVLPRQQTNTTDKRKNSPSPSTSASTGNEPSTSTPKEIAKATDMRYKKNIGRADRHVADSTIQNKNLNNNWELSSINSSLWSQSHTKRKWTEGEVEEFFDAVKKLGVGNWSLIKEYLETNRTNVMLKDKWRTMLKSGDAQRREDLHKEKTRKNKS